MGGMIEHSPQRRLWRGTCRATAHDITLLRQSYGQTCTTRRVVRSTTTGRLLMTT